MTHPIILDACSIINLLRIDDEDDAFLFKHLISLDLHIVEKVHKEVIDNYRKNELSNNKARYIDRCIIELQQHLLLKSSFHKDNDIEKDISSKYYDELKQYSRHGNKPGDESDGELLSTALALVLSRSEATRVFLYTDDMPATKQLLPYFSFQQIGTIMDTVDLLVFMYWTNPDFRKKDLEKYLSILWEDISQPLKKMVETINEAKGKLTRLENKDSVLRKNIDAIIDGYQNLNIKEITMAIAHLKEDRKKSGIVKIINGFPKIEYECHLVSKIRETKKNIQRYEIFKI